MNWFRYVVADVFTDTPLEGNQLAVFTDARELPEDSSAARGEMDFSETVFVSRPRTTGMRGFDLHADDRAAVRRASDARHGVRARRAARARGDPLETFSGIVPVRLEREEGGSSSGGWPSRCPRSSRSTRTPSSSPRSASSAPSCPVELYDNGVRHVYVALGSEDEVAALAAGPPPLARVRDPRRQLLRRRRARAGRRGCSRRGGVAEDPATGSAAGPLALHLARHGRIGFGDEIEISQGVEVGRPSTLYARVEGSADDVQRVEVGGSAVIVARGELKV